MATRGRRAGRVFWGGARLGSGNRWRRNCLGRLLRRIRMIRRVGRFLVTMVVGLMLRIGSGILAGG